jgi:hypothetical protein
VSTRPLVSVIVPTYAHRSYLLQTALASICGQEGIGEIFDLEVIVADNASADPTPDVIRRFHVAKHIQMGSNRGLWAALNEGLKEATGKYVAFLIDDDIWLRHKLRVQVQALESEDEMTIAYSQQVYVSSDDVAIVPRGRQPSGNIFRDCLLQNTSIAEQAILVPREAFDVAGYFDEDLESAAGDADMWLRLAFHFPFKFVPGPVAIYVRSIAGMASTKILDGSQESEFLHVLERALALLGDSDEETKQRARAQTELWFALLLQEVGELERMAIRLTSALERFPWMARSPSARDQVARQLMLAAMASKSPMTAVRSFAQQLASVSAQRSGDRRAMTQLVGALWAESAVRSARMGAGIGPVSLAASRAFVHSPTEWRRRRLLRLILSRAHGGLRKRIRRRGRWTGLMPVAPHLFANREVEWFPVLAFLG